MFSRRTVIGAGLSAIGAAALPEIASCAAANRLSVLDFIPSREHDAIRSGHSLFDCSAPVQRAIDEAAAAGQTLFVPAGTYLFDPAVPIDNADRGSCFAALLMRSGMWIEGISGAVFKVRDGASTDSSPRSMGLLCTTEVLSDIRVVGLTMDMNGAANPISPGRAEHDYNLFNQSHILVTGPSHGADARIDGAHIERCQFRNTPGVSCIVMAQTNRRGAKLGRNWAIIDNLFANNGLDTHDHSSIFAWSDDVTLSGNTFLGRSGNLDTIVGGNTCFEVHGSRHSIQNNSFSGYLRGIWVASNYSSDVVDTIIQKNTFKVLTVGVEFFKDRAALSDISHTLISDNIFYLDDSGATKLALKACVQVGSEFGQRDISVQNNRAYKTGTKIAAAFGVVTGGIKGAPQSEISFTNNSGTGFTFGIFIRTSAVAGLGTITARDNEWTDLAPAGVYQIAVALNVESTTRPQPITRLSLGGGSVISTRVNAHHAYGVRINGEVLDLDLHPIEFEGAHGPAYIEDGAARVRSRQGTLTRDQPG